MTCVRCRPRRLPRARVRTLRRTMTSSSDGLDLHVNGVPRVRARRRVDAGRPRRPGPGRARSCRDGSSGSRDGGHEHAAPAGHGAPTRPPPFTTSATSWGSSSGRTSCSRTSTTRSPTPDFRAAVEREAAQVLAAVGGRPSLAVLCGNSEVEQQVAMLGLDPALGRGELFGELLPALVADSGVDAVLRALGALRRGAAVPPRPRHRQLLRRRRLPRALGRPARRGALRGRVPRVLQRARRGGARRSSAPDARRCTTPLEGGRPARRGLGLGLRGRARPLPGAALRRRPGRAAPQPTPTATSSSPGRSRGEVMARGLRRVAPGRLALRRRAVLWLRDLLPGRRAGACSTTAASPRPPTTTCAARWRPSPLWTHRRGSRRRGRPRRQRRPAPLRATLRVAPLQRRRAPRRGGDALAVSVPAARPGRVERRGAARPLRGRLVGLPLRPARPGRDPADARCGSRRRAHTRAHFPAGRPLDRESTESLGLAGGARALRGGELELTLTCARLAYGVRIHSPGYRPQDDCLTLEPGAERVIALRPGAAAARRAGRGSPR